jgi:phage tail-like protein
MTQAIPEGQDSGTGMGAFNFHVSIELPGLDDLGGRLLCDGAFSEVTGLEASMEVKAIKAGGHNIGLVQRAGIVTFPTVVLRRGMTSRRDLWIWWNAFTAGGGRRPYGAEARGSVQVTQLDEQRQPAIVWKLANAMPVKFKAADLSARSGDIAVEELHLVHEGLTLEAPQGTAGEGGS